MDREQQDQTAADEELARKAKLRCMKFLEYSDRTEAQLRRKLAECGFPSGAVEEAIMYVKQFHYLDDRRFAENYIRRYSQKKSMKRLAQDLLQKGVASSCIEEVLGQCDNREEEAAMRLLETHANGKDMTQDKVRWNQIRYLTGKGFSYDLARRTVLRFIEGTMDGNE